MNAPTRDLLTHELVGYLQAIGLRTKRSGKPFTANMIRLAVRNGFLVADKRGRDNWFTPSAVERWIVGGCMYGNYGGEYRRGK